MKNSDDKNSALLALTGAVRLIEQPADTTLQAPDFDEHGFPVMCGTEDFYALLTDNGRDKIAAMTFEPRTGADDRGIGGKTFFVKISEKFESNNQLVLKQADDYLICRADERTRFPDAQVFGVIASSAESGGGRDDATIAPLYTKEQNRRDEFDQTRRPNKPKTMSPGERKFEKSERSQSNTEFEYDYDADFGA